MGGTVEFLPDGSVSSLTYGFVAVGGGNLTTSVNDNSDATYVTDTTPGAANTRISWTFANTALPAGSAIKLAYPKIRCSQPTGNRQLTGSVGGTDSEYTYQSPGKVFTPLAAIQDFNLTAAGAVPQSYSQHVANNFLVSVLQYPASAFAEDHRIYRVSVQVQYVDSPAASAPAISPAGANTNSTRPGLTWTYSSPDGMPQYQYRVVLWKLSDINLFPGGRAAFESSYTNIFERTDNIIPSRDLNFVGTDSQTHSPVWGTKPDGFPGFVTGTETSVVPDVDLDGTSAYVYYVQVAALHAGERLFMPTGATSYAKLDFTQAVTIPSAPTSVTPTWQRDFQFRTQVQVAVPAQTLGTWTGRKVYVERKIAGSSTDTWRLIPLAVQEAGASAGTLTFYDTLPAVNQTLQYRAKAVLWNSSSTFTSAGAYTTSAGSVLCDFPSFVLRDPLSSGSSVVLRVNGDLDAEQSETQGKFQPLATSLPVVVSDGVKGRTWHIEARVKDQITETFIDNLRLSQSPLVLHTDMDNVWYWVRFGETFQKTTVRQVNRRDSTKREQVWRFDLVEVGAVPGQPQVYF